VAPNATSFLADLYHNLGGLEHARGHFRRGEQFARKGLQLRRRVASCGSLPVAVDMAALAAILAFSLTGIALSTIQHPQIIQSHSDVSEWHYAFCGSL
jgi:hypothetical protein